MSQPNPNMTYEGLQEQIKELTLFDSHQHDKNCGVTLTGNPGNCDCNKTELSDKLIQLFATLGADLVGPDVPIFIQGKEIKRGETMDMDFSEGLGSRKFEESCRNLQENGRNLEKADIRTRLAQLTTKNTEEENV